MSKTYDIYNVCSLGGHILQFLMGPKGVAKKLQNVFCNMLVFQINSYGQRKSQTNHWNASHFFLLLFFHSYHDFFKDPQWLIFMKIFLQVKQTLNNWSINYLYIKEGMFVISALSKTTRYGPLRKPTLGKKRELIMLFWPIFGNF